MFDAETTSELCATSATLDEIKAVLVWHKMFYKQKFSWPFFWGGFFVLSFLVVIFVVFFCGCSLATDPGTQARLAVKRVFISFCKSQVFIFL